MELLRTRRIRWMANGTVSEQDAYCCTSDEWAAIVAVNPLLAAWGVYRFADIGLICAVSPPLIGAVVHEYAPGSVG